MSRNDYPGAAWRKSRYSNGQGECVEIACNLPGIIAIRDSKDPDGGILVVDPGAFRDLTARIKQRG